MSNDVVLLQEWEGRIVPRAFSVGYIVLSYLVSYVGAWTTLELINRRTGRRGLYNWSILFGSSISMGGIAIWCMHFISNRAIVLADGQTAIQIAYSPGFTTLSFFVPILVLLTAFMVLGSDDRVSLVRVTVGGTLAGLAICGMHYLGQAGISNYISIYSVGYVVGAAVVAVVASIVALSVFFVLRATWTNSWWKRALCAIILAGAVFGMHWLASVGTQYRLKHVDLSSSDNISRNSTVIVVIVLSIAACFILIIFTMLAQRRRSRSANRAQQVVLACAIFDKHGRIMVTPEGLLPNQKVTNSYVERSLDDVFGISHPVFHWIFRVTHNWSSVSGLLPSMRKHLYQTSTLRPDSNSEVNLNIDDGKPIEDYSIIFRELFCIAAADLAEHLDEPLEDMGILSDEIFNTGQTAASKSEARPGTTKSSIDLERDEIVTPAPGRGQLLFLTRRVDRKTSERFSASGYRFAEIQNVVHIIGRSMQINRNDLQDRLSNMFEHADETHNLKPGVHLAFFAVRARVRGSFEVLVRKDASNQLPTIQLQLESLNDWKIDFLSQLDNCSVKACLKFLRSKSVSSTILNKEQTFATQLHDALGALEKEINDPLFADALLIAKPVSAPCCGVGEGAKPGLATLITFRLMLPIQFRVRSQKLEFTPLSFFRMQQHVYRDSPDHAIFARKIHREFGSVLNTGRLSIDGSQKNTRAMFLGKPIRALKSKSTLNARGSSDASIEKSRVNSDTSSEVKLVETQTFGGIMVSQEVSVDVKDLGDRGSERGSSDGLGGIEMAEMKYTQMGTRGMATKEAEYPESYVDILFAACAEAR